MKIDHLIVATDLSENSGIAARWAASAAPKFEAEVTVLHVVELGFVTWLKSDLDVFDDTEKVEQLRQLVSEWYEKHTGKAPDHVVVEPGSPLVQIRNAVEATDGESMVVLARSSKGGFEKFFLGSTVHQVVADPPASVAIVHPDHAEATGEHPIVTGTDFSENADLAVQMAIDMCQSLDGKLHIVHANQIPQSTAYAQIGLGGVDLETELHTLAEKKMDQFLEDEIDSSLDVEIEKDLVLDEEAADALLHAVEGDEADMLVVGHNGSSPLVQNVLGSVTQQVLRNAACTIIVVPVDTAEG